MRKILICLMVFLLWGHSAQAAVVVDVRQVGGNVEFTSQAGGTLDLTGLTYAGTADLLTGIAPSFSVFAIGTPGNADLYDGVTGPASFGIGGFNFASHAGSGDYIGIDGPAGRLLVSEGYVSGALLGPSWTEITGTYATLGLTAGTYVYSWAGDSVTLNVAPVPIPGALLLFVTGLLGLWGSRKLRKSVRQAA